MKTVISFVIALKNGCIKLKTMTEQEYEDLPNKIKEIVDSWDDNKNLYEECHRIKKELNSNGWTCDYGLDGMVHSVVKLT